MKIYEVDYTRRVDEHDLEYVEFSLTDSDTLEQVIYALAELYDKSPTSKGQIQNRFATFGLKLEKGKM